MPEIGEITLTVQILSKYLENEILESFEFVSGRYTKNIPDGFDKFIEALPLQISSINSQGKFLWIDLIDPKNLNVHWYIWNTFGLTGMWSFHETKYTRAILTFN